MEAQKIDPAERAKEKLLSRYLGKSVTMEDAEKDFVFRIKRGRKVLAEFSVQDL
jgi:hypothetical protein